VIGGLTGGVAGAVGAGASSGSCADLERVAEQSGDGLGARRVNPSIAAGLAKLAGTCNGNRTRCAGRKRGRRAARRFNEDTNNRTVANHAGDQLDGRTRASCEAALGCEGSSGQRSRSHAMATWQGESDVTPADAGSNGNFVGAPANARRAGYDEAKAFIATQAKGSFHRRSRTEQQLFTTQIWRRRQARGLQPIRHQQGLQRLLRTDTGLEPQPTTRRRAAWQR